MDNLADIGLIGLAVMGQNLVLNMNDHGFTVAVYNRTSEKVSHFLQNEAADTRIIGAYSVKELVEKLKRPRKVMIMIKAGDAVDHTIAELLPYLEAGDIIIDGGNSNFQDSARRVEMLESRGLLFVGAGISGGEEGARHGPSIMPGGSPAAWEQVKPILQSIAAKLADGTPCCDWVGEGGAGHFVKMVHNGIEYGDMQLICEGYHLIQNILGIDEDEMSAIFKQWNQGVLESFLIEITGNILAHKDEDGQPLVRKILDVAGQKGTGKWTVANALDEGTPLTLIAEAVLARFLSSFKDQRAFASTLLRGPEAAIAVDKAAFAADLEQALYAAKLVSYTQGYMLMHSAAQAYGWNLNYGGIARIWREGCIIRSVFLTKITDAYERNPALVNLLLDEYFINAVQMAQAGWRRVVAAAVMAGVPVPALSSALAFFDGYRHEQLPANLLQAQRDYFGAHTYERVDRPRGEYFHTNWTGEGGNITAATYQA